MKNLIFDGNFSLQQLQDTLTTEEQLGFTVITSLKKRDELPVANIAVFEDDPSPNPEKPLTLIEVLAGDKIDDIVAKQLRNGDHLICCEQVFVSGVQKQIAVFR
jgi:hypothetical protein